MVIEDNMPDAGTDDNMGEQLVLYGMAGDIETNSLTFTIWDAAVPALPLIAQILLALFLALGGARLYRRRQGLGSQAFLRLIGGNRKGDPARMRRLPLLFG